MKKALFAFVIAAFMVSNVHSAGISLAGFTAEKLYRVCSADKAQAEFIICISYFAGWLDGVTSQKLHTSIARLKASLNEPTPHWSTTKAYQCFDLGTSHEELAKKYVVWFSSKISTLRENDIEGFKKSWAWTAIAGMMKEIYYCKLGSSEIGKGLEIRNVKSLREVESGVDILVVRGEVSNVSKETRIVPRIKVALNDGKGIEIQSTTVAPMKNRLLAGGKFEFVAKLSEPSAMARRLEVTFTDP